MKALLIFLFAALAWKPAIATVSISTTFLNGRYTLADPLPSNAIRVVYAVPLSTVYVMGETLPANPSGIPPADVDSLASAVATMQSAISGKADAAAIPQAAAVTPNADASAAAMGASGRYAREDHTHPSTVRKVTLTVAGGAGQASGNFSPAFGSGVVPHCVATILSAANATQPFVVNQAGDATNTGVAYKVFQAVPVPQNLATLLLGAVYSIFNPAPNGTQIKAICAVP